MKIIKNISQLSPLSKEKRIAIDTETTPENIIGASALDPHTSKIRLIQLGTKEGEVFIIDLFKIDNEDVIKWFHQNKDKEFLAFNAKFEMKFLYHLTNIWLNIKCPMVAFKHLGVSSGWKFFQDKKYNLRVLCRDVLDLEIDKELQKSNWSGELTEEQYKYAAIDVSAPPNKLEIKNILFELYDIAEKEAIRLEQHQAFLLDQLCIPVIAEAEYRGIEFNKERLLALKKAAEKKSNNLVNELGKVLGFKTIPHLEPDLTVTHKPSKAFLTLLNSPTNLVKVINKKCRLNLPNLKTETIASLNEENSVIKTIKLYITYSKLVTEVNKYLNSINPKTGRVHSPISNFNVIGTSTGRMSSSGNSESKSTINIQQISGIALETELGRLNCRSCIQAKENYILLDADYSAQEIILAGAFSKDEEILNTYRLSKKQPYLMEDGEYVLVDGQKVKNPDADLHFKAATSIHPELKEINKKYQIQQSKVVQEGDTKDPRSKGKNMNFQTIYGGSDAALSRTLSCSIKKAASFLKEYFKLFSSLYSWLTNVKQHSKDLFWVRTLLNRKIFVGEDNAKNLFDINTISRKGANAIIQGGGAIMMKLACVYIRETHPEAKILAIIHDGILIEIKDDENKEKVQKEICQLMIKAGEDLLKDLIEDPPVLVESTLSKYWEH